MRISDWSSDVCSSDLNVQRQQEIVEAGIHIFATQLVLVGKADGMNDEIDGGPAFSDCIERPIERAHVRHVAFDKEFGAELRRQRPNALFQRSEGVGSGRSVAVRVDLGGRRNIKKKKKK